LVVTKLLVDIEYESELLFNIVNSGNGWLYSLIVGCGSRSVRDKGAFSRIPKIREHEGPEERARGAKNAGGFG